MCDIITIPFFIVAMQNVYSPTQLEFLRKQAAARHTDTAARYSEADVRALAGFLLKQAAWYDNWTDFKSGLGHVGNGVLNAVGDQGWLWDTGQNAAGNLSGYGGLAGSILGSTGGAVAGSAAMPGVGTAAGGVAGGVAGGAAGRGLGYALGSGIDWMMGNKPGLSQMKQVTNADGTVQHVPKHWAGTVFDPASMATDGVFGLLPGAGKGLQYVGRGLLGAGEKAVGKHLGKTLGREVTQGAVKNYQDRLGRWGVAKALGRGETKDQLARWGMKAYQAPQGAGMLRQTTGRMGNYAQNMGRAMTTRSGLKSLAREGMNLALPAVPLAAAGGAARGLRQGRRQSAMGGQSPFTNTQGATQVIGNTDRGFSGVGPLPRGSNAAL